jgi:hypothetical protein
MLDSLASVVAVASVLGCTDIPLFTPSTIDYLGSDDECHKAPPVEIVNISNWRSKHYEDDNIHYAFDDDPVVCKYNVFMTSELV